jgi:type IX secretion system PorP/SprF family membrane protein
MDLHMNKLYKGILLTLLLMGIPIFGMAQVNQSYSQYYLTPYLINPGALGAERVLGIDLNYQKSFISIPEAPESFMLLAQSPIGENLAVGITAFASREGVSENVGGMLSVSYSLRFSKDEAKPHFLNFGLSGGYAMRQSNGSLVENPADLAVSYLNGQPSRILGQIGLYYQLDNLAAGLSVVDLFDAQSINYNAIQGEEFNFVPLNQTFSFVKYDFVIANKISLSPYVSYASYNNDIGNGFLEGMLLVNYNEVFWGGASYIADVGAVFRIGFSLKSLLKIGYGYSVNTASKSRVTDSHEMLLSYRKYQPVAKEEEIIEEEEAVAEVLVEKDSVAVKQDNTIKPVAIVPDTVKPKEEVLEVEEIIVEAPVEEEAIVAFEPTVGAVIDEEPGNYIIVGAFSTKENAQVYSNAVNKEGYSANVAFYSKTGYYYVILSKQEVLETAKKILEDIRTHEILDFKKAWILSVNK